MQWTVPILQGESVRVALALVIGVLVLIAVQQIRQSLRDIRNAVRATQEMVSRAGTTLASSSEALTSVAAGLSAVAGGLRLAAEAEERVQARRISLIPEDVFEVGSGEQGLSGIATYKARNHGADCVYGLETFLTFGAQDGEMRLADSRVSLLAPGEAATFSFTLTADDPPMSRARCHLRFYDHHDVHWQLDQGETPLLNRVPAREEPAPPRPDAPPGPGETTGSGTLAEPGDQAGPTEAALPPATVSRAPADGTGDGNSDEGVGANCEGA
ncbi:hypothetical protein [Streptomyces sp. NPDC058653]|uniref:hypothetical protein n=1 Tax=Streptomyces sp. NPDC058653 TaxID=3346576 RepID=UPI0036569214